MRPGGATDEVGHLQNTCTPYARYKLLLFDNSSDMHFKWPHVGQGLKENDKDGVEDGSRQEEEGREVLSTVLQHG